MKKFLVSILALVYFTISIRANVHLHDCMDEFEKTLTEKSCKKDNKVCCEDDTKQLHLDAYQKIAERAIYSFVSATPISTVDSDYCFDHFYTVKDYSPPNTFSSRVHHFPLFILHCVFRI